MRRPIRLVAACVLTAGVAAVPFLFRKPPTTLASVRWLAVNCEGLATGGQVLDPSQNSLDSLASLAGVTALPGPAWLRAGRAATAELFPLRIFAVLFPADSSVLAAVAASVELDPTPEPADGRFVDLVRIIHRTVAIVNENRQGASLEAGAKHLHVERP